MSQFELFGIDSPCIGVCTMNKQGYCIGCLRNRTERQAWHQMSDDEKRRVILLITRRAKRIRDHRAAKRQAEPAAVVQVGMFGE